MDQIQLICAYKKHTSGLTDWRLKHISAWGWIEPRKVSYKIHINLTKKPHIFLAVNVMCSKVLAQLIAFTDWYTVRSAALLSYSSTLCSQGVKIGTWHTAPGYWLFCISACMITRELRTLLIVQEAYSLSSCFIIHVIYIRTTLHNHTYVFNI